VVLLGDGALDGTRLQQTVQDAGWSYVCRTGCPRTAWWDGETCRLDTLGACSQPGTLVALSEVWCTRAHDGPMMLICCWAKGCKEPLYLVTNMNAAEEACRLYSKRFRIETFILGKEFYVIRSSLIRYFLASGPISFVFYLVKRTRP
jgi:hypothetical protein